MFKKRDNKIKSRVKIKASYRVSRILYRVSRIPCKGRDTKEILAIIFCCEGITAALIPSQPFA